MLKGHSALKKFFNSDNLTNFTTAQVFRKEIFNIIFEILKIKNRKKLINFKNNLIDLQKKTISPSYFGVNSLFSLEAEENPFSLSIEQLKEITKIENPIFIMKIFLKTIEKIFETIDIYNKKKKDCKLDLKSFSSEDFFSILVYIVFKSNVYDLICFCELVEFFLTENLRNSIAGYYFISLNAAALYFSDFEIKPLTK